MSEKNKFPGRCVKCRVFVGAYWGYRERNEVYEWVTICKNCSTAGERERQGPGARSVRITVAPTSERGEWIALEPAAYLGEHEDAYEDIIGTLESWYQPGGKHHVAREALLEVVRSFKDASFAVALAPELVASLQSEIDAAKAASAEADARILALRAEFKSRGKFLRPYQEGGVAFLAEHEAGESAGALLADDMGLGKTIQVLGAWKKNVPAIVVCPANVKGNWAREIRTWRPDLRAEQLHGINALRRWPRPGEVLILGYDSIGDAPPAGSPEPGTILVGDEAHRLKKGGKKPSLRRARWDALRAVVVVAWLLTGSPLVNQEGDLWLVLEAAGLGTRAFGSRRAFGKLLRESVTVYKEKLRTVMLRRMRDEVLGELPPIVYTDVTVEISEETRAELDGLLKIVIAKAVEKKVEDAKRLGDSACISCGAQVFTDARSCACGEVSFAPIDLEPVRVMAAAAVEEAIELCFDGRLKIPFELISRVKALLATAKAPASVEFLDDLEGAEEDATAALPGTLFGDLCDDPIVFASAHLMPLGLVSKRQGWRTIQGGVSSAERDEIVASFQAGEVRGLALAIKAGGEGITLTRASRLLVNDPEWTPAAMDQVEARLRRMGQAGRKGEDDSSHVQVVRFIADHVLDARIQEILDRKRGIFAATVDVANVGAEHRQASVAKAIESVLEGTTKVVAPALAPGLRRAKPEEEAARVVLASGHWPGVPILKALGEAFRRNGGLTERQWEAAASAIAMAEKKRSGLLS